MADETTYVVLELVQFGGEVDGGSGWCEFSRADAPSAGRAIRAAVSTDDGEVKEGTYRAVPARSWDNPDAALTVEVERKASFKPLNGRPALAAVNGGQATIDEEGPNAA